MIRDHKVKPDGSFSSTIKAFLLTVILSLALSGSVQAATGGPDGFGYRWKDFDTYSFADMTGHMTVVLGDNQLSGAVPIGFPFTFYGNAYTQVYIDSNGIIRFADTFGIGDPEVSIPTLAVPNLSIYGWWADLDPSLGGSINYLTTGSAPNQIFVVEYNVLHYGGADPVVFQIKLFETTNVIEVHYQKAPAANILGTDRSHTAGIENGDGTIGLVYYFGLNALADLLNPKYIRYLTDTTSPDTTITGDQPADPTNATTADFTFSGNDGAGIGVASFECKLDGEAFIACTSPKSYTGLGAGSHTFQVRAIDLAGNTDPTPAAYTWTIDLTAPDTTLTGGQPANPTNGSTAAFTFTSSDPTATFECQLDGEGYSACTSPKPYTGLSAGAHTFDVRAKDPAGNMDPTPAAYTWTIDLTAPDTTLTGGQPANPTNESTAAFTFTSSDPTATFECQLDGEGYSACTSPKPYTGLSAGAHTFDVRAKDPAGNMDPTPAAYTWTIDLTLPDTTITGGQPANPTNNNLATFTFNSSDPAATFECQIDGGGFLPCTTPRYYTGLSEGPHTFQVRAINSFGSPDPTPASYTWVIDNTGPVVTIHEKTALVTNSTMARFTFTSNESPVTFKCKLCWHDWVICSSPQEYTVDYTEHTFQVKAVDSAGNEGSPASYTWTVRYLLNLPIILRE